jgi:ribosomal protein S18 acetylase RimI-like enzyme
VIGSDVAAMAPPTGVFLVARTVDGVVAGCGGVQSHVGDTAEIKRMWIDPASRGAGVGRRLLGELEARCRRLGYARIVLDTNATLVEAIAMYESAGYRPTERYNDNPYAQRWFVKELAP